MMRIQVSGSTAAVGTDWIKLDEEVDMRRVGRYWSHSTAYWDRFEAGYKKGRAELSQICKTAENLRKREAQFEELVERKIAVVENRKQKMIDSRDKKIRGHNAEINRIRKKYEANTKDKLQKDRQKLESKIHVLTVKIQTLRDSMKPFILKLKVIDINNLKTQDDLLPLMVSVKEMKEILKFYEKVKDI